VDAVTAATLDGHGLSTRELNERLRELLAGGAAAIDVAHPGSRHSLAVGFLDHPGAAIRFHGDVGYFCGGLSDGLDIAVFGNAGWSLGADMMSGSIVVDGNSGSSTGASMRGGLVVVKGDAGARSGIAGKGGTLLVGGSTGYMSGFMNQRTRVVVCGDAGPGFGDSMYEGELYCGGRIESLGSDTLVEAPDREELDWLQGLCAAHGLAPAGAWQKVRSAGRLWRYDKKEFSVWREAL
jgi:glutamate synthase domain-containing protein 3